jgi:hypothetical protein
LPKRPASITERRLDMEVHVRRAHECHAPVCVRLAAQLNA